MSIVASAILCRLVEIELQRQTLYEQCKSQLRVLLPAEVLSEKELSHLLLRYIFNKIIVRQTHDDPVFIVTRSPKAEQQLEQDFLYYDLARRSHNDLTSVLLRRTIEEQLAQAKAALAIYNDEPPAAGILLLQSETNSILYKSIVYNDVCGLAQRNPQYAHYALALNIRYTYLSLWNQGLARCYQQMNIAPDEAIEAFSSAFNHHCVHYCSAFPDLESVFGSLGSFFQQTDDTLPKQWILLNPPFDSTLIEQAIDHVEHLLHTSKKRYRVLFTVPAWKDFPAFYRLKSSSFRQSMRYHPKGTLPFIDHMSTKENNTDAPVLIYPCAINEVEWSNSNSTDSLTESIVAQQSSHKRKLSKYQEESAGTARNCHSKTNK